MARASQQKAGPSKGAREVVTGEESIRREQREWRQTLVVTLVALVVIDFLPKPTGGGFFRLVLMIGYFGAVFYLLYQLTVPREIYFRHYYAWRYADGGPSLEQTYLLYLSSLRRVTRGVVYIAAAFVVACELSVLAVWFPALGTFALPITLIWWFSLIGLLFYPFGASGQIAEVMQRRQLLRESIETGKFKSREIARTEIIQRERRRPAVEATGELEFRAGGFDWDWEDFYKSAIVFGQSGTGKTVCVLNALLDGLLASANRTSHPAGGLILDPKGDFRNKLQTLCRRHGRERDLLILDPASPDRSIRWNPLDSNDDELELATRFAAVLESTGMKGGDDSFWIDSAKKFLRHSIALLRLTNPAGHPPSFAEILQLATSYRAIAERTDQIADDDARGDQCLSYFADEWTELADNTRTSIQAYITNMIDPFMMEPYKEIFSGQSTKRIAEMVDEGRIIYVYMPIADREAMSRVVCTFVKLEYYREVLKRPDKTRPSFFLCDEFQSFFTTMQGKGDADFFERSRQSRHANIIATQNLPALKKQSPKEEPVKNLLGNCAIKLFLRNTDDETNKYSSELFGQRIIAMASGGVGQGGGRFQMGPQVNQSASRQYDAVVRPEEFPQLAVPDRREGVGYCETILHLASRGEVGREKLRWNVHPLQD